jgi:hypothetical protein
MQARAEAANGLDAEGVLFCCEVMPMSRVKNFSAYVG